MTQNNWTIYIIACADGSLYTGITNNLSKRVAAHNAGVGAKYTKGRGPVEVVYTETCGGRSEAAKREIHIKQLSRAEKLQLIAPQ